MFDCNQRVVGRERLQWWTFKAAWIGGHAAGVGEGISSCRGMDLT